MATGDSPQAQRDDARDRTRLCTVAEALDRAGVRWWVDHGTLLGLVRDGRPLPWDDDLDLSFAVHELDTVMVALVSTKADLDARVVRTERGVKVLPHEATGRVLDLAPYSPIGTDTLEKAFVRVPPGTGNAQRGVRALARRALVLTEATLSVFDRWVWNRRRWSPAVAQVLIAIVGWPARLRDRVGQRSPSRVPRQVFDCLGTVRWGAVDFPAPAEAEAYLALRYGADWRTPRAAWTWWDDDHTVDADTRP